MAKPAAAKWSSASSHGHVAPPGPGRGVVSLVGRGRLYYSKTVGASGAVSAGRNWGRVAGAGRRRELKLVASEEAPLLLYPDEDALSSGGGGFSLGLFSNNTPLMIQVPHSSGEMIGQ